MRIITLGLIALGFSACKKEITGNLGTCKTEYQSSDNNIVITTESTSVFCLLENYNYSIDITNLNLNNIEWNNGESSDIITISEAGTFSGFGLNSTNDTIGFIFEAQDCDNHIYIPNTFTPNSDGVNDNFRVYFEYATVCEEDYKLSIFDPYHQLIYNTNNAHIAWDGTYRGSNSPQGVYHYILEYKREDGETFEKSGQFLLMR